MLFSSHIVSRPAALLEEEIQRLLPGYMPTISNMLASRLFDDYGPLNSFAAKIDVARALDLIDVETYTDLRAIQVIRKKGVGAEPTPNKAASPFMRPYLRASRPFWRNHSDSKSAT